MLRSITIFILFLYFVPGLIIAHPQHSPRDGVKNLIVENNYISQSDNQFTIVNDCSLSSSSTSCYCCFGDNCIARMNKCLPDNSGFPQENCNSQKCNHNESENFPLINFSNYDKVLFTITTNCYFSFYSNLKSHNIGSMDNSIRTDIPIYISINSLLI